MQALDRGLPAQAVFFSDLRSHAFAPRPFIPSGYRRFIEHGEGEHILRLLKAVPPGTLFAATHAPPERQPHVLRPFLTSSVISGDMQPVGTRNPFNNSLRPLYVYRVDSEALRIALRRRGRPDG
jgi:hypothetical protein